MVAGSVGIRLEGLSAVFHHDRRGDVVAVDKLDLDIAPGEFLTLLGASGCGKTTTLRMIAGFQSPSSGRILFGEDDVTALRANQRDIGFVFQNYALFPHLSVFENVAYGLRVKGQSSAQIATTVGEGLERVGLTGLGDRLISELSGGQQQRVALARAIAIRPRVLLFDEPLSNLDAQLRIQMRSQIAGLQRDLGITTVYVTHDQEEAMAISRRIAIMKDGRITQIGTAEDLYRRPNSPFVAGFLGSASLIGGNVVSASPGRTSIDVGGHVWDVATDPGLSLAPGDAVETVLRPEALTLLAQGMGLPVSVEARTYLGAKAEYIVRWGKHTFQVTQSNPAANAAFEPGQTAVLALPQAGVQIWRKA